MSTAEAPETKPAAFVNRSQAGDRARAEAEHRRLPAVQLLDQGPGERGGRGAQGRGEEGLDGHAVGGEGRAGVEAIPAGPEEARADDAQDHAVRGHRPLAEARAGADEQAKEQGRPTGGHVHDDAAGEIGRLEGRPFVGQAGEVAGGAPDGVRDGVIDEHGPEGREEQHGGELHAFGDGPDDERGGDRREHGLEEGERRRGDPRFVGGGAGAEAAEAEMLGAAEDVPEQAAFEAAAEHERVAEGPPHQEAERGEGEALRGDGEHVLAADKAAVEEEEPRDAHHQHEGGADENPGVVAGGGSGDGRNEHNAFK